MAVTTDILPSRYRDARRIGRGGMGDIYHARDSVLVRDVAVKILGDRYAQDQSVRQRFTREALAAARLSGQPNTVTIFDVGEHNGRPYIVMEYLGGGSLDDGLREHGAQPPQRVFTWLEQAGRALDAAHALGVVHRDVKPGNLLLDREGNVHVADFGIASAAGMDSLTMTGTVLGTAGYLAPEQAEGKRATPASDRYALAIVAFELLTGSRPFESDNPTAEAAAHVNAPVPSISASADVPRELDRCFARALAKDPGQRFATGADFVAALRAAYADAAGETRRLATAVTRPVPAPPAATSRRTSPAWPVLAALLVSGAIAGALLAYFLTRDNGSTPAPTTVLTRVQTVTTQGQVTTVERTATVTTAPVTTSSAPSPSPSAQSGVALNNSGYAKMQAGDYAGALPLLEQAVSKLAGTGVLDEAYAKYNLAYTRYQLGNCDGVLDLLDQAEAIEGHKAPIDRLRAQAQQNC
ncbi:MAG TPA: serine/threonine-protein kinase [Gaiellaceae bacterium]|nr:serine/threonine-protein kinase [Gaiellaceae bacterium]